MNFMRPLLAALVVTGYTAYGASTFYVNVNNQFPSPPYDTWAKAATIIQYAVDQANAGDTVLVTNGVYQAGRRLTSDGTQNRVVVTNSVTVQAVNGPSVTTIDGLNAIRCVYLTNSAGLEGFTLTGGKATSGGGAYGGTLSNCTLSGNSAQYGGGAYDCRANNCTLSNNSARGTSAYLQGYGGGAYGGTLNNCTLRDNSASNSGGWSGYSGGGAYVATLNNCTLSGNSAQYGGGAYYCTMSNCTLSNNLANGSVGYSYGFGGGVMYGTLNDCTLVGNSANGITGYGYGFGGGAYASTLNNCTLSGNSATGDYGNGGGARGTTLNNCTLKGNSATTTGGGAYDCTLNNCTVSGNSTSTYSYPASGAGVYGGTLKNSIVYYNYNFSPWMLDDNWVSSTFNYCCTTPLPSGGLGNISYPPLFVDVSGGNLRLQAGSPCINSGYNAYAPVQTDLGGNPRVSGGTVDMGAYEFQNPLSVISYAWLQSYGWPTDGSVDYADPDGDGMNNWREWCSGTIPTNAGSVLKLSFPTGDPSGITVTWQSVIGKTYYLQKSTDFAAQPAFLSIQSNIVGQAGTTSYKDVSATNARPYFYRVGLQ
jgi:hypothetical protein